jgi:hypothetical protein
MKSWHDWHIPLIRYSLWLSSSRKEVTGDLQIVQIRLLAASCREIPAIWVRIFSIAGDLVVGFTVRVFMFIPLLRLYV